MASSVTSCVLRYPPQAQRSSNTWAANVFITPWIHGRSYGYHVKYFRKFFCKVLFFFWSQIWLLEEPNQIKTYLHEPKEYLFQQILSVVRLNLRGCLQGYSSFTYVLYVYGVCQQLIELLPVIPVPWWADDWCPNSRLLRVQGKRKRNVTPQYPLMKSTFSERLMLERGTNIKSFS